VYDRITLKQVVEVVGDAAGEAPDRLHLLRGAELLLGLAVGGQVDHHAGDAGDGIAEPGRRRTRTRTVRSLPWRRSTPQLARRQARRRR
jgi:hypothetical protein